MKRRSPFVAVIINVTFLPVFLCCGQLTNFLPNGRMYIGDWLNDRPNGYGTEMESNWQTNYFGYWKDGVPDGRGKMTLRYMAAFGVKETTYEGDFKNGMMWGHGTKTRPDGTKYVGEFKRGVFDGQGLLIWPDGRKYVGGFKNSKFDGEGTMTWPDGRQYIGQFSDEQYLGLSARLTNAIVRTDNSIELDFILHNSSNVPIQLAERWNSWGAYQWRFRVVDADGTAYELENPHFDWTKNFLTTFTIAPLEDQITRCRLDMSATLPVADRPAIFALSSFKTQAQLTNRWVFPVAVTGIFTASKYTNEWPKVETTWEGGIATEPLVIAK